MIQALVLGVAALVEEILVIELFENFLVLIHHFRIRFFCIRLVRLFVLLIGELKLYVLVLLCGNYERGVIKSVNMVIESKIDLISVADDYRPVALKLEFHL